MENCNLCVQCTHQIPVYWYWKFSYENCVIISVTCKIKTNKAAQNTFTIFERHNLFFQNLLFKSIIMHSLVFILYIYLWYLWNMLHGDIIFSTKIKCSYSFCNLFGIFGSVLIVQPKRKDVVWVIIPFFKLSWYISLC